MLWEFPVKKKTKKHIVACRKKSPSFVDLSKCLPLCYWCICRNEPPAWFVPTSLEVLLLKLQIKVFSSTLDWGEAINVFQWFSIFGDQPWKSICMCKFIWWQALHFKIIVESDGTLSLQSVGSMCRQTFFKPKMVSSGLWYVCRINCRPWIKRWNLETTNIITMASFSICELFFFFCW